MLMVAKPRNIVIYCDHVSELLGRAKALVPIWNRKVETSREIIYGEIKAYINI